MDLPLLTFPPLHYDEASAPELIKTCKSFSRNDPITGAPPVIPLKNFISATGVWISYLRENALISVVSFTEPCPTPMPIDSMKELIEVAHYGRDYYFIRVE